MSGLERKLARFQAADSHLTAALTPAIHSGQESNAFNDLAGLLNETHRQVEAEPLFRRALEIKER